MQKEHKNVQKSTILNPPSWMRHIEHAILKSESYLALKVMIKNLELL